MNKIDREERKEFSYSLVNKTEQSVFTKKTKTLLVCVFIMFITIPSS